MTELVDSFMKVLGDQPLSLALCAMNLLLLWFLFKSANTHDTARRETMALVVQWQKESQAIMADCVSKDNLESMIKALSVNKDNLEMVINALSRDRETYRALLPTFQVPAATPSTRPDDLLKKEPPP